MDGDGTRILTVNAGSSSIKFDIFYSGDSLQKAFAASIDNIGQQISYFSTEDFISSDHYTHEISAPDHAKAAEALIDWLHQQLAGATITAVGHRIVHGGPKYHQPTAVSDQLLTDLRELTPFDPEHMPTEIQLIELMQRSFPGIPQVVCFDTAFHHGLPTVSRLLPIPRHYESQGIRRYGFHGLSYTYLMKELRRTAGADVADKHTVLAHLGSGVSLAAVQGGLSIDTTMALTPAAGVPMSSRSGDLDPGLALYLAKSEGLGPEQFNAMVNFRSGLLGISEISADMKQLLEREEQDSRAKEAVDIFCYQVKKSIGGLAAGLGGLDTLVFSGGMGEKAPKIRTRICDGLEFLGIKLEPERNSRNDAVISADDSRVTVRVIHTDEASTIAEGVLEIVSTKTI